MKVEQRKSLIKKVFKNFSKDKNILNITFAGSFLTKKKFNDIDIIFILKRLSIKKFVSINNYFKKLRVSNRIIKINNTFGPVKYNDFERDLVFHLMVYDLESHINHVIRSPFTCYDWEKSSQFTGKSLKELFPVGKLQLRDFKYSRRGIFNYLNDLDLSSISYTFYHFSKSKKTLLKKKIKKLSTERELNEYAFHIIKNLIFNFIKYKKNINKTYKKLSDKILKLYFSKNFLYKNRKNIEFINHFKNKKSFNKVNIKFIKNFVKSFLYLIDKIEKKSTKVIFYRHAKTSLNNGIFLGTKLNPGILKNKRNIIKLNYDVIYCSPLNRAIETAKTFFKSKVHVKSNNLLEINYGDVEGMKVGELKSRFSYILKKWKNGADVKFPNGENYEDVKLRLGKFIRDTLLKSKKKNICVITHNVLLRCLVGISYNIPKKNWHKIIIPHMEPLEFLVNDNILRPNIPREKLKNMLFNL